jgi:hypothetical protein
MSASLRITDSTRAFRHVRKVPRSGHGRLVHIEPHGLGIGQLTQKNSYLMNWICHQVTEGRDMKQTLAVMLVLPMLAAVARARPIDWQAELDRCRALREQMEPLLLAGQTLSPIARSATAARRCVWIERRALKHGAR